MIRKTYYIEYFKKPTHKRIKWRSLWKETTEAEAIERAKKIMQEKGLEAADFHEEVKPHYLQYIKTITLNAEASPEHTEKKR